MKISKKDIMEHGVEVDMPIENKSFPAQQRAIRYKDGYFELYVICGKRKGEVDYKYKQIKDLVRTTNQIYNYDDEVVA